MIARLNKEWKGSLGLDKGAKFTTIVLLLDAVFVLALVWLSSTH